MYQKSPRVAGRSSYRVISLLTVYVILYSVPGSTSTWYEYVFYLNLYRYPRDRCVHGYGCMHAYLVRRHALLPDKNEERERWVR